MLNTLSIGQFHLFLGVKHVLVLEVQRAQIKTLVANKTDTISSSGRKEELGFYISYLVDGDDVIRSHSQQTHISRPERKEKRQNSNASNVATLIKLLLQLSNKSNSKCFTSI